MNFARARKVADTVLYEGYILYPYRASAHKNQVRWQFGVVAPRAWSEAGGCEGWVIQTECLLEADDDFTLTGTVRFLQEQKRTVEEALDPAKGKYRLVDSLEREGSLWTTWDEAVEREVDFVERVPLTRGDNAERLIRFAFPQAQEVEAIHTPSGVIAGRFVRSRCPVEGLLRIQAERWQGPYPLVKIRLRIENVTAWNEPNTTRNDILRSSFVGTHTLLAVQGGRFISLLDPPEWARPAVASCVNVKTWPVLIGDRDEHDVMLSSPIILYDYPEIAPESPGDLFDATEIDELLTLRTMTLTEEEKREARATDQRAAAIIDRVDTMPPEILDRLHGAIRYLRAATNKERDSANQIPWWDPSAEASVSPETDSIAVRGIAVARGSRVRLCPALQRADAQDMFLKGRTATVAGVFFDVDEKAYLAVTLEDDPAADLRQWHGRYFYFSPDEVEPLEENR
jgi:hypothetical protein